MITDSPLGQAVTYSDAYDPTLLFSLPRADKRTDIGIQGQPPFVGADLWTAYELSWLNTKGKPQVALAHFVIPSDSISIIESKSLKLYLNSFNMSRFDAHEVVQQHLITDLSTACGLRVGVRLTLPDQFHTQVIAPLHGLDLDRLDLECTHYTPTPDLLSADHTEPPVTETFVSHLLKSNCLITHQPDWGSVQITYTGATIDQAGLLRYLVSYRGHDEFHEQCVERIFMDIWTRCRPSKLSVYARYTRRGGLDINPYRCSHPAALPSNARTARQ
ncbi:7-cyano-7-deazaguanine reductase [Leptothrix ochracea L12]|uniref:NADPH-dependent 7-cyano-7-deazaguanine reductase n=1 Tax=Leptothrix ochracea L12 TaxID=735332 RepID=I4Z4Y7_9BURK|nr:NADPH-dependent 7-cyano-7-deazaguanine reductase QueF [Leptothrix ochracea]EIM31279.1 7-cyano-7-deazaguanine reductase [Leptothrix ochracea L12]